MGVTHSKPGSAEFLNLRIATTVSGSFTISNVGGGTLSGPIETKQKWLKLAQHSIDTTRHKQDISFFVDTTRLPFGLKETGTITIQSNGGVEKVLVDITVEMPERDLSRFRNGLTIASLTLGALFGYFIYNLNLIQGMSINVAGFAGIVALIGVVTIGGKLGYKEGGGGAAFAWGCGSLIAGAIVLAIFKTFPHALSILSWSLAYGSLSNLLSIPIRKSLWRGDKKIPLAAAVAALILGALVVFVGYMGTKAAIEASSARERAREAVIRDIMSNLSGEWNGRVNGKVAKLSITLKGNQVFGRVTYGGVEEQLSGEVKNDGQILLKGISFRRLSWKGSFALDNFYGSLSDGGDHITGKLIDANGMKGEWSASKLSKNAIARPKLRH
jgi:hypothetical protein